MTEYFGYYTVGFSFEADNDDEAWTTADNLLETMPLDQGSITEVTTTDGEGIMNPEKWKSTTV